MSVTIAASESSARQESSNHGYRTSPDQQTVDWPPGIPYIVGNEACERFSFYGMRSLLAVHLASLYAATGLLRPEAEASARATTHLFFAGSYALPMIGAILADRLLGKYRTILFISLIYCLGNAILSAFGASLMGMYVGLALVAIGAGGIKPCVSANVGDQFGKNNWFRVRTVFQIFYFSINFGSFFSYLLIPTLQRYSGAWVSSWLALDLDTAAQQRLGTSIAFGVPGVLMFLATLVFWLGRRKFVHVPPKPGGKLGILDTLSSTALFLSLGHLFFTGERHWGAKLALTLGFLVVGIGLFVARQKLQAEQGFLAIMIYTIGRCLGRNRSGDNKSTVSPTGFDAASPLATHWFWRPAVERFGVGAAEGPVAVLKIVSVFALVCFFWALFDQKATSWVEQAGQMDLHLQDQWDFLPREVLSNQVQSFNPLFVMVLIPLMNLAYRKLDRLGIKTTPLRRMTVGMFAAALAFVAVALIQARIDELGKGRVWFVWQALPIFLITVAEIMVSITGLEFAYTQAPKEMKSTVMGFWLLTVTLGNVLVAVVTKQLPKMELVSFFWLFAGLMAAAAAIFGIRAVFYVQKDYAQE